MFTQPIGFHNYDSAEWTTGIVTDYDVSAQSLFVNCKAPTYVSIRVDTAITVRFNGTTPATSPAITISPNTTFELPIFLTGIYITTTAPTAVKIILAQV